MQHGFWGIAAVMRMPGNHAFLSPSSSVRWYFCPPSAHLCGQYPDQGSVYAAEGTEAHALCEYLLKSLLGMECEDLQPSMQYYLAEMEEAAQGYVQFVSEKVAAWSAVMKEKAPDGSRLRLPCMWSSGWTCGSIFRNT